MTVCKPTVCDPQLVYETILKARTQWLLCGCTEEARRHSAVGSGCSAVRPSPQPRRSHICRGPPLRSGLGRGRRWLYQLVVDPARNIQVSVFCAPWLAEFRVLLRHTDAPDCPGYGPIPNFLKRFVSAFVPPAKV